MIRNKLQIYNFSAVWHNDELIRCWGQKVKGQGHNYTKYGQISTLGGIFSPISRMRGRILMKLITVTQYQFYLHDTDDIFKVMSPKVKVTDNRDVHKTLSHKTEIRLRRSTFKTKMRPRRSKKRLETTVSQIKTLTGEVCHLTTCFCGSYPLFSS